ncbi:hypothetical protein FB45DRAFT_883501 [Roridomyces roridus]|uniref:Uncharacterized protein n=1 Tax=Roridomyces roridus TaxID=1738132 RepID=A0AAD7AWR7_9AGAR|nr:hypothetical protein FB45DRAFT_883501 [Roridomyces roridus]
MAANMAHNLADGHTAYQKPRLRPSSPLRSAAHLFTILRLFMSLLISTLLGFLTLPLLSHASVPDTVYFATYMTFFLVVCSVVFGEKGHRDNGQGAEIYYDESGLVSEDDDEPWSDVENATGADLDDILPSCDSQPPTPCDWFYGPARRLRGGSNSDQDDSDIEEYTPGKRKRRPSPPRSRKVSNSEKGKQRAHDSDDNSDNSEDGILVTRGKGRSNGMRVAEVIHIESVPEYWDIPPSDHSIAYIVDLSATPECLKSTRRLKDLTVDAFIKKQCQDSLTGPTGVKTTNKLAEVLILDPDEIVPCRRSNLSCGGCFVCNLAAPDHLAGFERWVDDGNDDLISAPIRAAKKAEGMSLLAIATAFYESVMSDPCQGVKPDGFTCGGHAVMRRFQYGPSKGKQSFVGCSSWSRGDGIDHIYRHIDSKVKESVLSSLFQHKIIQEEDIEDEESIVNAPCVQVVHPSHLPNDRRCPRTHLRESIQRRGTLIKRPCPAQVLILIPIDETDLRAVVIPKPGIPHNHPLFPRVKVPFHAESTYKGCAVATGPLGATTLRVDKSSATRAILGGKLPQEIHPSLINNHARRGIVQDVRGARLPSGTGMSAVWAEFEKDKSRAPEERYIHAVSTLADDTHVIITMDPGLASLALDAIWIMVDTTFVVVHGKTNEWKLLIWLDDLDKRTTIGRVWSNRATREAFVLVWNGIFEAIRTITGKALNFKAFSKTSNLLGALGDSEAAQAQGLGDVIILRRLNPPTINGTATVDVDTILMFIWKTCIVHFFRGLLAIRTHLSEQLYNYLRTFPFLKTDSEITLYYTVCGESTNPKLKAWWAHKVSYPWLLPSLNRHLSKMDNKFWDLTPSDTNALEGSHAGDNRINHTNHALIEAILLARQLDSDNARIIKASVASGVWENGNNSTRARFKSQATRQANVRARAAANTENGTGVAGKQLKAKLAAAERLATQQELEIQELRSQLSSSAQRSHPTPHSPTQLHPYSSSACIDVDADWDYPESPVPDPSRPRYSSVPEAGPSKLPNLLTSLFPMASPARSVASDFDYALALQSEYLDPMLEAMARSDFEPYPVDGVDDVLASDPHPSPR